MKYKYIRSKLRELINSLTSEELDRSLDDFAKVRNQFADNQDRSLRDKIILDYFEIHQENEFPKFLQSISQCNKQSYNNYICELENSAIIELKEILKPLEKSYFQQLKHSSSVCFPKYKEWSNNIEDIFNTLDDIHKQESSLDSVIRFVALLLSTLKIAQDKAMINKLKQWGQNNHLQLDGLLNQKPESSKICLIILIEPSFQEADQNNYIIKSWLVESDSKSEVKNSLEITYQKKETFSLKEIPKEIPCLLKYFIDQSASQWDKVLTTIEFFLPRELFNQPIDTFIPKKFEGEDDDDDEELYAVGMKYHVSIRSYQRIKKLWKKKIKDQKIKFWEGRWETLYSQYEQVCCPYLILGDNSKETEILRNLLSHEFIGIKLFETPSNDILKAIDSEGIPVALWLRSESKKSEFMGDFEAIINDCSIARIPEEIKDKRKNAYGKKNHIGNNIVLLWDNPNILPPEILPASLP